MRASRDPYWQPQRPQSIEFYILRGLEGLCGSSSLGKHFGKRKVQVRQELSVWASLFRSMPPSTGIDRPIRRRNANHDCEKHGCSEKHSSHLGQAEADVVRRIQADQHVKSKANGALTGMDSTILRRAMKCGTKIRGRNARRRLRRGLRNKKTGASSNASAGSNHISQFRFARHSLSAIKVDQHPSRTKLQSWPLPLLQWSMPQAGGLPQMRLQSGQSVPTRTKRLARGIETAPCEGSITICPQA